MLGQFLGGLSGPGLLYSLGVPRAGRQCCTTAFLTPGGSGIPCETRGKVSVCPSLCAALRSHATTIMILSSTCQESRTSK